jgi:hypothetical protein
MLFILSLWSAGFPPGLSDLLPMNPEIVPRFFRVGESTGSHKVLARLDWSLLASVMALAVMGLLFIFSATLQGGHVSSYMVRQGLGLAVGIVAMVFLALLPYQVFQTYAKGVYGFSVALLIFTLLFGTRLRGSRSWIDLGSLYFQPVEITRLGLAVALAAYANARSRDLHQWRGSIPPLLMAGVHFGLVLMQPDLSSALVMGPMTLAILFAAGMPLGFLVTLIGVDGFSARHSADRNVFFRCERPLDRHPLDDVDVSGLSRNGPDSFVVVRRGGGRQWPVVVPAEVAGLCQRFRVGGGVDGDRHGRGGLLRGGPGDQALSAKTVDCVRGSGRGSPGGRLQYFAIGNRRGVRPVCGKRISFRKPKPAGVSPGKTHGFYFFARRRGNRFFGGPLPLGGLFLGGLAGV